MNYLEYIPDNAERVRRYTDFKNLYSGEHYQVFDIKSFEYYKEPRFEYISKNIAKVYADSLNSIIFAEDPVVQFPSSVGQKWFDDWVTDQNVMYKVRQASLNSLVTGDSVLYLSKRNNEVLISQLNPAMWFPIYDMNNTDLDPTGHILVYEVTQGEESKLRNRLLEVHTAGRVEYVAYKETSENEWVRVDAKEYFPDIINNLAVNRLKAEAGIYEYETGADFPLVFNISNNKSYDSIFGNSDFTDSFLSKQAAINQLANQIQYILKRHSHPKMQVPKNLITQAIKEATKDDTNAQTLGFSDANAAKAASNTQESLLRSIVAQKIIEKVEFFSGDINAGEVKYLTWDGKIDENLKQIEMLVRDSYDELGLSQVLINPDTSTGQLSGSAITRLATRTFKLAQAKQSHLASILKRLFYTAAQFAGVQADYPTVSISGQYITDPAETNTLVIDQLNAGLITEEKAIMTLHKVSEKEARDELQKIKLEKDIFTKVDVNDTTRSNPVGPAIADRSV